MKWRSFNYRGVCYDLSHLHPFDWVYIQPASGGKPERKYHIEVSFSLHTFTKKISSESSMDKALQYRDTREVREFDFERYALSKRLVEIVKNLGKKKCFHTRHHNFFTVEVIDADGRVRNYEVYFVMSKSYEKQRGLKLFIQSAYERTLAHGSKPKKRPPIGFHVITYNTMKNKMIKVPRQ